MRVRNPGQGLTFILEIWNEKLALRITTESTPQKIMKVKFLTQNGRNQKLRLNKL